MKGDDVYFIKSIDWLTKTAFGTGLFKTMFNNIKP